MKTTYRIPLSFADALNRVVPKENRRTVINIVQGDCRNKIQEIEPSSMHAIITDPPYFIDGLDNNWKKGTLNKKRSTGSVGGLPVGMNFDPKQGIKLQEFMQDVGGKMIKVLMPGGFCVVFSQPRLMHRMAIALENAGFEIRDLLTWRFTKRAQFKAFSMNHFVDRMQISGTDKRKMKRTFWGWKTPQLRPQFESVILAQKPREGTFIENWLKYKTGLINSLEGLDGKVPSTVMTVEKPLKEHYNCHLTVKPLKLIKHLIKLFTLEGQTILDPFLGSGTTAVAAKQLFRSCTGIEINKDYISIAEQRLKECNNDTT
jgi:DNA modification methylase